jgi:signal transduction histidine kinase/DNA-binding response OmpR family regulator
MVMRRNSSISRKLTWMNMFVSGAALLLACAAFITYDLLTFRATMVRNLSAQAQTIGASSVSALLFNDAQSAENSLSALKAVHNVLSAAIYSNDGRLFASYVRDPGASVATVPLLSAGQFEAHWFKNKEVVLVRSIVFEGQLAGTVCIRSDVKDLDNNLKRYLGIAGVVLSVCLVAARFVSSIFRRAVAEPVIQLADVAKIVSREKNYSVRVHQIRGTDEVAVLIDAFNEMLGQIQQNERALREARDDLERRVKERTAELERAKSEVEAFSASILYAKEELERASKFKDQFLSTMSHELRTPLNAVLGFSELLGEERYGPLNERQQRYIKHIHTGGKHLLSLINDILDLSKIEAGRLELTLDNVPVDASCLEVADTMRPLADRKSQTLSQEAPGALCVRADATRFKQVLMNLVGNAIKFTPEGGQIHLSAKRLDNVVRIEVRDSGPGIPVEEQQRIFEAFYRVGERGAKTEGTGLGLAITRRLVELHGGSLGLESQPGLGSCFYFTLPLVKVTETREGPESGTDIPRSEFVQILVIEDDRAAAQLLQSHLASAGYEVVLCDETERALEMAAELQPSAVTMDIIMKPINGWELLSAFKTDPRTAPIPVILVTIMDQPATAASLGADDYIVKPVQRATLIAAVERCLSQRKQIERMAPILVVEDDAPTREFVAELLSRRGYIVSTAANGAEARSQVSASVPELVILDLILPDISGFQLLAEWRAHARTSELPVFVLTSKDLGPAEQDYIRTHARLLLQKQHAWQETLLAQLRRVVPTVLSEKS